MHSVPSYIPFSPLYYDVIHFVYCRKYNFLIPLASCISSILYFITGEAIYLNTVTPICNDNDICICYIIEVEQTNGLSWNVFNGKAHTSYLALEHVRAGAIFKNTGVWIQTQIVHQTLECISAHTSCIFGKCGSCCWCRQKSWQIGRSCTH